MGSTWDTWSRRIAPTVYQIAVFGGILRKLLSDLVSPPHANASYLPCVSIPNFSGFVDGRADECYVRQNTESVSLRLAGSLLRREVSGPITKEIEFFLTRSSLEKIGQRQENRAAAGAAEVARKELKAVLRNWEIAYNKEISIAAYP
jgi:hypothetical protein